MIKNDFANELNQFLSTFYEIQYKDSQSMTYLYIPKDSIDKPIEELIKNKELVKRFEGRHPCDSLVFKKSYLSVAIMLKWHHQLKNLLLIQDRLMNNDNQFNGIQEEIDYWQTFLTNLHFIRTQLERKDLLNIIQILNLSKSVYIQQFFQVEKQIQVSKDKRLNSV